MKEIAQHHQEYRGWTLKQHELDANLLVVHAYSPTDRTTQLCVTGFIPKVYYDIRALVDLMENSQRPI